MRSIPPGKRDLLELIATGVDPATLTAGDIMTAPAMGAGTGTR